MQIRVSSHSEAHITGLLTRELVRPLGIRTALQLTNPLIGIKELTA